MNKSLTIIILYTALVIFGGVMGYHKAGSAASLWASSLSGGFLAIAAVGLFYRKRWAFFLALSIIFVLDAFFTYRLISTKHFIPSGLMSLVSSLVLLLLAIAHRRDLQRKK